jgi:hypothetical protein
MVAPLFSYVPILYGGSGLAVEWVTAPPTIT